ncbi:sarcosine oxidase subunit gamma family protein [Rhizobium sp. S152]|uniref:sarcosine oxidase subunit gamma family protein n=1 Tax=Rhizobium sp. S152 TaxID=3055038 RepID=UPI0025AA1543|nr:sarcosine oxidase subunit gamma family protein [Rhizobium sp. S152]MDM9624726.1 sarcosine oxidase subunit gamma family protein [Rhizobium sp. S152]
MTEFRIVARAALAGRPAIVRTGVRIEALPDSTILQIMSRVSADEPSEIYADASAAGLSLRPIAPGQWLAVKDAVLQKDQISAFADILKPRADVVDQSHGRVRILVCGPMVTRVLAKGTAVDLSLSQFPVAHALQTLFGHIGVHVTRTSQDDFELIVLRGFAESLWDELARMSLEFS